MSHSTEAKPAPFLRFRDELLQSYGTKNKDTLNNMRRALDLLVELNVKTTADLTPEILDRVESRLQGKTEKTTCRVLWLINAACNQAVKMGYLASSPFPLRPELHRRMMEVAAPTVRKPGPSPAKVKQALAQLAEQAKTNNLAHRLYAMVMTVAYTGLLPYTVGTIRIEDVDFDASAIHVPHVNGLRRKPRYVAMPDELASVLENWLHTRGHHIGRILDEEKVAEARRLKGEGWSMPDLCERFGVKRIAMYNAITGRTWKHVPTEGEMPSPVRDSEWLFPNLNPTQRRRVEGPAKMNARDAGSL